MPKLEVGDANNSLEHEADAVADRVMRMSTPPAPPAASSEVAALPEQELESEEELIEAPPVGVFAGGAALPSDPGFVAHRKCASCSSEQDEELRRELDEADTIQRACTSCDAEDEIQRACASCDEEDEIQRACASCESEDEEIMREAAGGRLGGTVSDGFSASVRSRVRAGGTALPREARAFLEPRLGVDLGYLRVHADAQAGLLAKQISARAFTLGHHIFFAPGEFRPQSSTGMRLIAHEVAHTLQTPQFDAVRHQILHRSPEGVEEEDSESEDSESEDSESDLGGKGPKKDRFKREIGDVVFHSPPMNYEYTDESARQDPSGKKTIINPKGFEARTWLWASGPLGEVSRWRVGWVQNVIFSRQSIGFIDKQDNTLKYTEPATWTRETDCKKKFSPYMKRPSPVLRTPTLHTINSLQTVTLPTTDGTFDGIRGELHSFKHKFSAKLWLVAKRDGDGIYHPIKSVTWGFDQTAIIKYDQIADQLTSSLHADSTCPEDPAEPNDRETRRPVVLEGEPCLDDKKEEAKEDAQRKKHQDEPEEREERREPEPTPSDETEDEPEEPIDYSKYLPEEAVSFDDSLEEPGCPASRSRMGYVIPTPPCQPDPGEILDTTMTSPPQFCLDSDVFMSSKDRKYVRKFAEKQPHGTTFVVRGYASPEGPGTPAEAEVYNQRLSCHRAKRVTRELINAGVPERDIITVGMGPTEQWEKDPNGKQLNRRALVEPSTPIHDEDDVKAKDNTLKELAREAVARLSRGEYKIAADAFFSRWTCGRFESLAEAVSRTTITYYKLPEKPPLDPDTGEPNLKLPMGDTRLIGRNTIELSSNLDTSWFSPTNNLHAVMGRIVDLTFHHFARPHLALHDDDLHEGGMHLLLLTGIPRHRIRNPYTGEEVEVRGLKSDFFKDHAPPCADQPLVGPLELPNKTPTKNYKAPSFEVKKEITPSGQTSGAVDQFEDLSSELELLVAGPAGGMGFSLSADVNAKEGNGDELENYEIGFLQTLESDKWSNTYLDGRRDVRKLPVPLRDASPHNPSAPWFSPSAHQEAKEGLNSVNMTDGPDTWAFKALPDLAQTEVAQQVPGNPQQEVITPHGMRYTDSLNVPMYGSRVMTFNTWVVTRRKGAPATVQDTQFLTGRKVVYSLSVNWNPEDTSTEEWSIAVADQRSSMDDSRNVRMRGATRHDFVSSAGVPLTNEFIEIEGAVPVDEARHHRGWIEYKSELTKIIEDKREEVGFGDAVDVAFTINPGTGRLEVAPPGVEPGDQEFPVRVRWIPDIHTSRDGKRAALAEAVRLEARALVVDTRKGDNPRTFHIEVKADEAWEPKEDTRSDDEREISIESELMIAGAKENFGSPGYGNKISALLAAADAVAVFAEADQQAYDEEKKAAEIPVALAEKAVKDTKREKSRAFFRGKKARDAAAKAHQDALDALAKAEARFSVVIEQGSYRGHEVEWTSRVFRLGDKLGFSTPLPGGPSWFGADNAFHQSSLPPWKASIKAAYPGAEFQDKQGVRYPDVHTHPRWGDPNMRNLEEVTKMGRGTDGLLPSEKDANTPGLMLNPRGQLIDTQTHEVVQDRGLSEDEALAAFDRGEYPQIYEQRKRLGSDEVNAEIEVAKKVLRRIDRETLMRDHQFRLKH